MAYMEWHTYTASQAQIRAHLLTHLLDSKLLTAEEEKTAKRLLAQFKERPNSGDRHIQIYANDKAEELLQRLEESLWEAKG